MLSTGAFNALLKTLEEPPAHVIFILATTEIHKVPATILSRCQRFDLSHLSIRNITEKLTRIAKEEKIQITPGAIGMIAEIAEGGMRDAESLLTQIASLTDSAIDETTVSVMFGSSEIKNLVALATHLADKDLPGALRLISTLSEDGKDLSVFAGSFLNFLRKLLLSSASPKESLPFLEDLAETHRLALIDLGSRFTPEEVVRMLEFFQTAKRDSKNATIPELPLEIAIVKTLSSDSDPLPKPAVSAPPVSSRPAPTRVTQPVTPPIPARPDTPVMPTRNEARTITPKQPLVDTPAPHTIPETATANFSLPEVKTAWKSIVEQAKILNASLALALMQSSPIEARNQTLVIQTKHNFHKERLDTPESKLTLGQAFAKILSFEPKFQIVLEKTSPSAPETTTSDPSLVSQALEMLGGKIVPEQG